MLHNFYIYVSQSKNKVLKECKSVVRARSHTHFSGWETPVN